jgi:hypothetical protein
MFDEGMDDVSRPITDALLGMAVQAAVAGVVDGFSVKLPEPTFTKLLLECDYRFNEQVAADSVTIQTPAGKLTVTR